MESMKSRPVGRFFSARHAYSIPSLCLRIKLGDGEGTFTSCCFGGDFGHGTGWPRAGGAIPVVRFLVIAHVALFIFALVGCFLTVVLPWFLKVIVPMAWP